jgi:outer membrane protein OmpA-like peptidoglycan-associated protein
MSLDILESVHTLLGENVTRQASAALGEAPENTATGLRSGASTLLAGLMHNVTAAGGLNSLFRSVTGSSVDSGISGTLSQALSNRDALSHVLETGQGLVGSLFGNRADGISQALAQVAGLKSTSAMSLLALLAPVFWSVLKRETSHRSLDAGGLASLLLEQRGALQKSGLDSRITHAMGYGTLQDLLGSLPASVSERRPSGAAYGTPEKAAPVVSHRASRGQRWIPWVVGLAVAAIVFSLVSRRVGQHPETRGAQTSTETSATRLASLPARVYFSPGQASLNANDRQRIAEAASVAKAAGTAVAVTGYTDKTGSSEQNVALAKDRAAAVHEALVSDGVPESKIVMKAPEFVTGSGSDANARRVEITPEK